MHSPIRILLLDDHPLFREGLARLLSSEPGLAVSGQCDTIDDALSLISRETVDVVLLDYDLGREVGTNFLKSIAVLRMPPRVLLVTAGMPETTMREALAGGACGIVMKHSGSHHLIDAIWKAATEEVCNDQESILRAMTLRTDRSSPETIRDRPLTVRQAGALRGVLDGLSNNEIAQGMSVSESSVKAILQELFQKAGVRTRSQLVRVAIEKHLSDWIR